MRCLLLVTLLACGGSSKPAVDPAIPPADPAPCVDVAAHSIQFLDDKELAASKVKPLVVQHCRDDKWSVDLRKCILTATSLAELDPCEKHFVGTQLANWKHDLDALAAQKAPTSAPPPETPPPANPMPK